MMRPRHAAWLLLPIFMTQAGQPGYAADRKGDRHLRAEALAEPTGQGSTRTLYLSLIREARIDGRARAALAYLDDFDRQYPRDRDALVLRINCLLDIGQTGEAESLLKRVAPTLRDAGLLEVRGHVAAARGDWPQAARDYAAALEASPASPMIGNALGYAQLRSGDGAQAVESLKSAHDLAPREAVIRNNLALALTLSGRQAEAEALLATVRDAGARAQVRRDVASEAARLSAPPPKVSGTEAGGAHG